MKIFELIHADGEIEWITGKTNLHAIVNYTNQTQCDLDDLQEAELKELPKEMWSEYFIRSEDGLEAQSFSEWMVENGNYPDIVAGTMYE